MKLITASLSCSVGAFVLASCHLTYVSIPTAKDAVFGLSAKNRLGCIYKNPLRVCISSVPACLQVINQVLSLTTVCLRPSHPISSLVEDANALYLSSQRAVPLRCDFVNDNFSTSGSTAQPFDDGSACRFPVPPHAPHPAGALPSPPVFFPYSTDQKWTVALLKVLDDLNAPDYAFHAILTWARGAIADGFSFRPEGGQTRRRNVERLYALMNNATQLLPTVRTVAVPQGPSCDVITFDFVSQLLKLLQNRTIMTQDNLLIDVHNPLLPYTSPDGV
jgi:hypothetical protein